MREKPERRSIRRGGRSSGFFCWLIFDGRWRTSVSAQNRETARASSENHRKGTLLTIERRNHHPKTINPLTPPAPDAPCPVRDFFSAAAKKFSFSLQRNAGLGCI